MNMCNVRLVWVLNLFFICIIIKNEISAYNVEYFQLRKTWIQAQAICNNKGGRLATNKDGEVGLNCNQFKGSIYSFHESTYWTGRYRTISPWISKIGKYLNGNKCVCISEQKPSPEKFHYVGLHKCNGAVDSDNNYWAYKVTQNTRLNGTGNCAFVDCRYGKNFTVKADNCATKRTLSCDTSSSLNWNSSQEQCKHQSTPGDVWDVCSTMPHKNVEVWLPMHRVAFWTEVTCNGIGTEEAVTECESFRCYDDHGVPSITVNTSCSDNTNGFFCAFSSSYNMTTERTETMVDSALLCPGTFKSTNSHSSNERTKNVAQITGKSLFSTIINQSTMLQSTTSIIIAKQNDNKNFTEVSEHRPTSNIGLTVGGVLGALVIFGAVILVFLLKLRRKKASTKNQNVEQFEINNEDQQRKTVSNNIRVNQLYEDEGAHESRPVPVRTKETESANEQEEKKPHDVYAVVMKNDMTSPLQAGLNSVVVSEDVAESEYDRLNITPKVLTDNMEITLYDSSIADRCESDPTYNTSTNIRHSLKNTEDVYD